MKTGAFSCLLLYLQHLEYYLWYNTLFLNKYVLNKAQEYAWGAGQWGLVLLPIGGLDCKASAWDSGDLGLIPGPGRSPEEGNGNPLQYFCLENPMDGGAWCRLLSMGLQRVGHNWATSLSLLLSKSTVVSWLPVFLASSLEYTRQQQQPKKALGTHCWVIPLGPEAPSPVYHFISTIYVLLNTMPRVLSST